jgi:hypothetical protein
VERAGRQERLPLRHYILLQRAPGGIPAPLLAAAGPNACLLAVGGRVSISRARNILLTQARKDGALATALWAAFPDDDAWYPPQLLGEINAMFARSGSLALVTCAYGERPLSLVPGAAAAVFRPVRGYGELIRTVSSNTLMLRASLVEATGGFDERLGLGARVNGGEDLDYALRACGCRMEHVILSEQTLVGHRPRLPWVRSRYFAGSLFALARGARRRPAMSVQLARKLMVGMALVMLRELSARELHAGIRIGLAGWGRLPPEVS